VRTKFHSCNEQKCYITVRRQTRLSELGTIVCTPPLTRTMIHPQYLSDSWWPDCSNVGNTTELTPEEGEPLRHYKSESNALIVKSQCGRHAPTSIATDSSTRTAYWSMTPGTSIRLPMRFSTIPWRMPSMVSPPTGSPKLQVRIVLLHYVATAVRLLLSAMLMPSVPFQFLSSGHGSSITIRG
jgi:hypothetical protein